MTIALQAPNQDSYILKGNREINLDDQQTEAIRRVQEMELSSFTQARGDASSLEKTVG